MKSLCAILALFSLLLFVKTTYSRRDVGKYWKNVMKEQPMPQAIEGLLVDISDSTPKEKADCHEKVKKPFVEVDVEVEEFEPKPNALVYNAVAAKEDKQPFVKDFEPRPNALVYNAFAAKEDKQPFVKDFEPRPNALVYNAFAAKEDKQPFVKDFEPRPNAKFAAKEDQQPFVKDFEPRPNALVYND
ncbi:hypothetical protein PRUPE_8G098600 [Prunus persica]|uniref:Organ-specific protein S2 n=1 Tax=Prunus persica TaxID=3760 RepID=M5VKB9_PRUPE|nr:hypothetical protein PRUPE_8G098600 [Prunus persica]